MQVEQLHSREPNSLVDVTAIKRPRVRYQFKQWSAFTELVVELTAHMCCTPDVLLRTVTHQTERSGCRGADAEGSVDSSTALCC
jgi:hypothetical protein